MTKTSELNDLMIELLEAEYGKHTAEFSARSREIINEISDFAEQTDMFKANKDRGEIFDGTTSQQIFSYMLNRVVNAPTVIHRNSSIILIMPFLRKRLEEEDNANNG